MIGDHHENRVIVVTGFHCPPDQIIHSFVQLFNRVAALFIALTMMGWMILVNVPPEHMLNTVSSVEHTNT